ncbi:GDSL esterase/lipase At3g14820-like [Phragmites australis]|uniref:GDSL esterase/lipase At3g14820-like n=1 Tax=Phragmites australis TaxID=29695 RepID=UPI002D7674F2|nr:GDSL esterase/lipase At3g14820-like [Phragmites australis]
MENLVAAVLALAGAILAAAGSDVIGVPPPTAAGGGSGTPKVPALFAFGDSIVDTGNNNYFWTITRSNFRPYGRDFPGQEATGRFSDGKISMDFLASGLGLKEMLPPYLDKNLTLEDLKTGVSFASAGSGYDNDTSWTASAMTVEQQLQLLTEYKAKVGSIPDRALYLACWGSNDVVQYFTFANGKTQPGYADFMTQRASTFIQTLIELGARQIAVTGVPPVGCAPAQRLIAGGLWRRQCATDLNQLALLYNRKLTQEIAKLAGRFRGVNLVYIDLYSILNDIIQRYQALGFKNGKEACCGLIGLESGIMCNLASPVCEDPAHYVFWDGYHPTERAYKIMIDQLIARYIRYLH